ncbi:DUF2474 family protein [Sphingomonas sp. BK235]|uniref:DUF2474 family protein n=1 Tax=Sphingomonas sp. BK235 TaxID=2512131 RepID=UPI003261B3E4
MHHRLYRLRVLGLPREGRPWPGLPLVTRGGSSGPTAVGRLGWFVGLWLASITSLGLVAAVIRSVLKS